MDILFKDVHFAEEVSPGPGYLAADAYRIPFASDTFDLVCCHFLLLWLREPQHALYEMTRVLRPNCRLILFAEPDYGGRIDYPYPLAELGHLQKKSLHDQGCDPEIGRKLRSMLITSKLDHVETGVMGGEWKADCSLPDSFDSEWETLFSDLRTTLSPQETAFYTELDRNAWLVGTRVLYVPTFYATGKKPG
jgi:SAM-dependent methyltransferase